MLDQLSDHEISGTPIVTLVSSRNDASLENILMPIVTNHVFESNEDNHDVQFFIAAEVNKRFTSGNLKVPDAELIDLIILEIVARADRLFLQAVLLLDFVFAGNTSRAIGKMLAELPNGLEKTYETILTEITAQNRPHVGEFKRSLQ